MFSKLLKAGSKMATMGFKLGQTSSLGVFTKTAPSFNFSTSGGDHPVRKSTMLKNMLQSDELSFIMEAHNGLSAKIVEEAGFQGIWGSGLSISAALGVRDCNEASWSQVVDVIEFMSDATSIPLLLDGDTGYGNFNNARYLVKKLEQRNIGGVCIEDKVFPKRNSLLTDGRQELADIKEHALKLTAMKDAQTDPDFQIVARLEAFIAGWGLDEALKRAHAYKDAGADAVLIHSKESTCDEVKSFCKAWNNELPVVIVPTKYYTTPTDDFRDWGVSLVIWANHNMRASVAAMQETCDSIFESESLNEVEEGGKVVAVNEVFRIQDEPELKEAEDRYL